MRTCNLLRRVKDRAMERHTYNKSDGVAIALCGVFIGLPLGIIAILNVIASAQLVANHMVHGDVYNLTTGCALADGKCYPFRLNDVTVFMFLYPTPDTGYGFQCFGEISWLNIGAGYDGGCLRFGVYNFTRLALALLVSSIVMLVCWRILYHIRSYWHDATEIYQDEVALAEVKVH